MTSRIDIPHQHFVFCFVFCFRYQKWGMITSSFWVLCHEPHSPVIQMHLEWLRWKQSGSSYMLKSISYWSLLFWPARRISVAALFLFLSPVPQIKCLLRIERLQHPFKSRPYSHTQQYTLFCKWSCVEYIVSIAIISSKEMVISIANIYIFRYMSSGTATVWNDQQSTSEWILAYIFGRFIFESSERKNKYTEEWKRNSL